MIVLFLQSKEYSVVSKSWLIHLNDSNGKKIINIFWPPPPNIVDSDMLRKAIIPQHDWKTYPVIILDDGKEYNMSL